MSVLCPRCDGAIHPATMAGVPFDACDACEGLLVEQPRLIPLLEGLSAATQGDVPDGPIAPVPDHGEPVTCPDCSRAMERFGYMETRTVMLDRCTRCRLIWIDHEELPTLVQMFARASGREAEGRAQLDELDRRLSAIVRAGMTMIR